MEVNRPEVIGEVRATFDEYERALLANDLGYLDDAFWDDARVVRFAFGDVQFGVAAISAARRAVERQSPPRTLEHLTITTYGDDVATVFAMFRLDSDTIVHQSQTWAKFDGTWKVTAAHVSHA